MNLIIVSLLISTFFSLEAFLKIVISLSLVYVYKTNDIDKIHPQFRREMQDLEISWTQWVEGFR